MRRTAEMGHERGGSREGVTELRAAANGGFAGSGTQGDCRAPVPSAPRLLASRWPFGHLSRMPTPAPIVIDGASLSIADVYAVARSAGRRWRWRRRHGRAYCVRGRSWTAFRRTEPRPTASRPGFGKLSEVAIPPDRLAELQVNLVRSHAAGVGDLLPEREVRAMMLLRANVIAKGFSGARLDLAELLAGDAQRGPLSADSRSREASARAATSRRSRISRSSLIGEGTLRRGDQRGPARDMLRAAGLDAADARREGRAHAHQRHAGAHGDRRARARRRAPPVAHRARRRRDVARGAARHARRVRRAHSGRRADSSARRRRRRFCASCSPTARSASRIATNDPRVQDAYALRCMPQVHGPVLDAIEFASGVIGRELNAATDNPLVFDDGDAAERRQLSRTVGRDGARLPGHRAHEPRDDLRAAHRSAGASRSQPGTAAVPGARRRREFRIHDGAGDARRRSPASARCSRIRRASTRFRRTAARKTSCRWRWRRRGSCAASCATCGTCSRSS